jgi:DNA helicase-2/ATP-dependent DNA helicase PcrA
MRIPSTEQQAILERPVPRVRVVRAAPGSGKTWLVAEIIRQELANWQSKTGGIAALSFTRVGGEEIRNALGHELVHPHYVGTIDAFLFRYIIRPFFSLCSPGFPAPRLIAGEWGAQYWSKFDKDTKTTVGNKGINLFDCVFIGEESDRAVLAYKPHPAQPLQLLAGEDLNAVKKAKWEMWKRSGCLSHSDAAYWASRIANHTTHGSSVVAEIVRRFPFLVVDELQDTGYFLGKTILTLLSAPGVQGLLVGDPDQSIFEFNGARPDLFERFEAISGAVRMPLTTSRRCPSSITKVAIHLKDTGGPLGSSGESGRAVLISGKEMCDEVRRLVAAIQLAKSTAHIKVIARQNTTVDTLSGKNAKFLPKLYCLPLSHLSRAVVKFRQGNHTAAVPAARAALDLAVFGYEGVQDSVLEMHDIDSKRWRRLALDCLLRSGRLSMAQTLHDLQMRMGAIIDDEIGKFGLPALLSYTPGKLKPQKRPGWDNNGTEHFPSEPIQASISSLVSVRTVHGVKGETHDATIFVCPPAVEKACPSTVWWSGEERDREEKRVAYVALTRSKELLIVWVPEETAQRLTVKQPVFAASFERMTTDEFIACCTGG